MRPAAAGAAFAAALLLCSGAMSFCSRESLAVPGSHVLLITIDTVRADAVGCYGGPDWTTPVLDELADRGVRFDRARCTAPVTLPSHASILTGQFPFEHAARDNATFRLPPDALTLAERLRDEGYATAAVMGAFVLHSTFGLDQGFETFSDVPLRNLTLGLAEDQRTAAEVVDEALSIVGGMAEKRPLFLWAHFFDAHFPYDPPGPFLQQAIENAPPGSPTESEMPRYRYLAEVAYMDREIGRLVSGLRDHLGGDRILTVIVSDHGEGLGDHGENTHGFTLYDTVVRVPMIVHHEGLPEGRVIGEPVSLSDVAPTILGLLEIPGTGMSGADLAPLLARGAEPAATLSYFEAVLPYYNYGWAPLFGVNDGRFKLIEGPKPELYDLQADPEELNNVILQHADQAERLRALFEDLRPRARKGERIALSREDHGRIEALGYAGSELKGSDDAAVLPGRVNAGLRNPVNGLDLKHLSDRARALLQSGSAEHIQQAVAVTQTVLGQDPDNPTFLAHAGSVFYRAGMYSEAADVLTRSLEKLESAASRSTLAGCLIYLDRKQEAAGVLAAGVALHPFDLMCRFNLGKVMLEQGKAREALVHLNFFIANYKAGAGDELQRLAAQLHRQAVLAARGG